MSLEVGTRLAHYEILELVGRGGMGEVYRAKDSKLGRDVAIKVLPDEFAQDEERLRRFQREAKVLASLNHPNIAAIYGLEQSGDTHYLVLELVPGETLADRIARGPIPVEEALEIAKKIAEALEEAHERGIAHRDLKPANVKLTPDDKVKVLDFGLAKAFAEDSAESDAVSSMSPTITRDATRIGVILGTAAYMSPEQAKGKHVDKRTDIFSFGVVLYEMLTGKQAFIGEDVPEVLAAIINRQPNWSAFPSGLDARMVHLVRRCLRKESKLRLRDIGDARNELQDITAEPERAAKVDAPGRGNVWRAVALIAITIAIAIVAASVATFRASMETSSDVRPTTRLAVTLPARDVISTQGIAISPDGTELVYSARSDGGQRQLFRRSLRSLEAVPIEGTEGARYPFFSPDGQSLGFFADYDLRTAPLNGGPVVTLGFTGYSRGASWAPDGTILYATIETRAVMRVSAAGGKPEPVTTLQDAEISHKWPQVLPGGGALVFSVQTADEERIAVQSLGSGEHRMLLEGTNPRYVSAGYIVFSRSGSLWGAPFDADRLVVTGPPTPLLEDVAVGTENGIAHFGVANDGTLVYVPAAVGAESNLQFVWVDREGREEVIATEPQQFVEFTLSPDGTRVAVRISGEVWIYDLKGDTWTRLTPGTGGSVHPAWSHDGRRVAFRRSGSGMSWKSADGTGEIELLLLESPGSQYPQAFSPDGKTLVFEDRRSGGDLGMMSLQGERTATFLLDTAFRERAAALSPDGRWLAYESDDSGRMEVYVRPFPDVDAARWPVSNSGGRWPLWSPEGRELFYMGSESLIAVSVETKSTFTIGSREPLFDTTPYNTPGADSFRRVAVAPDGRFLLQKDARSLDGAAASPSIVAVQGWFHELERLVPRN